MRTETVSAFLGVILAVGAAAAGENDLAGEWVPFAWDHFEGVFSPDGKRALGAVLAQTDRTGSCENRLILVTGAGRKVLWGQSWSKGTVGMVWPVISPAGGSVLWMRTEPTDDTANAAACGLSTQTNITQREGGPAVVTGTSFARKSVIHRLLVMKLTEQKPAEVAPDVKGDFYGGAAFSRDGKRVVSGLFQGGRCHMAVVEMETGKMTRFASTKAGAPEGACSDRMLYCRPQFIPGSETVVFESRDGSPRSFIAVAEAREGSEAKALVRDARARLSRAMPSPDGKLVAYVASYPENTFPRQEDEVWVTAADGSDRRCVFRSAKGETMSSPCDFSLPQFNAAGSALYVVTAAGREVKNTPAPGVAAPAADFVGVFRLYEVPLADGGGPPKILIQDIEAKLRSLNYPLKVEHEYLPAGGR